MADGNDPDRLRDEIRTEVEAIDSFPAIAELPIVRRINITDQVISVAITRPMPPLHLKAYAEAFRARLVALPEVTQASVAGFAQRQVRISLDPEALRRYGVSVSEVARLVERQSLDLPSGTVETREREVLVRFADERRNAAGFADIVVRADSGGGVVRLGDLATINDRFEDDQGKVLLDGRRAALVRVTKTRDEDTLRVVEAVHAFLERERAAAPEGIVFALTEDVASIVEDRLMLLRGNGLFGFALVFGVMALFFSLRFA